MTRRNRKELLGVYFDNISVEEAAEKALHMLQDSKYHYCVGTNANLLRIAQRDPAYREAINAADLSLADGCGVVIASRIGKRRIRGRVACIDLLNQLFPKLKNRRVFILGGKPERARQAVGQLSRQYPDVQFCGSHHGYFKDPVKMAVEISGFSPDMLLVCLGSPKQEMWMSRYGRFTGARLAVGCGGWIDIASGNLTRAPKWWRDHNMEWTWRLLHEPWRIGRVCGSAQIVLLACRQAISRRIQSISHWLLK